MKNVNIHSGAKLSRRTLLRASSVSLALPVLDAMTPAFAKTEEPTHAKRFVGVSLSLGLHLLHLVPETTGKDYQTSRYLQPLQDIRNEFTVISGSRY